MTPALITYGVGLAALAVLGRVGWRMRVRWRNEDDLDAANRREGGAI